MTAIKKPWFVGKQEWELTAVVYTYFSNSFFVTVHGLMVHTYCSFIEKVKIYCIKAEHNFQIIISRYFYWVKYLLHRNKFQK
jgi:hypothetical protein